MKSSIKKGIIIVLTLYICVALFSINVFAEKPESVSVENIVYSEEELEQWLYDNEQYGGNVVLGDNITITNLILCFPEVPIIIDTNQFGLVFDYGYLLLNENVIVRGEGVNLPVIELKNAGFVHMETWDSILQSFNITAVGKNGMGGCALRVSDTGNSIINTDHLTYKTFIRSYGENAVGIEFNIPTTTFGFQIEVDGKNSSAISGTDQIQLFFCKLNATGNNAKSITGSNFTLNNCIISPEPVNATVLERKITGISGQRLYYPIEQHNNSILSSLMYYHSNYNFILSGDQDNPSITIPISVQWDDNIFLTDTSVLSKNTFSGRVNPILQQFNLEGNYDIELTVDVRDPDVPCIFNVIFSSDYMDFELWKSYKGKQQDVILWRSDDDGKTWYEYTENENIQFNHYTYSSIIKFYFEEITNPILLCLEEKGVGESNVVSIYQENGITLFGLGGDRTGADRDGYEGLFGSNNPNHPQQQTDKDTNNNIKDNEQYQSSSDYTNSSIDNSSSSSNQQSNIAAESYEHQPNNNSDKSKEANEENHNINAYNSTNNQNILESRTFQANNNYRSDLSSETSSSNNSISNSNNDENNISEYNEQPQSYSEHNENYTNNNQDNITHEEIKEVFAPIENKNATMHSNSNDFSLFKSQPFNVNIGIVLTFTITAILILILIIHLLSSKRGKHN